MDFIQRLQLTYRAGKYKSKHDKGGIAFLLESIQPGQTVMDIGAHKAGYLYYMARQVGPDGRVFAFEPQRSLYDYNVEMKRIMAWDNVTIEHLALSDGSGTVKLYIPGNRKSRNSSPGASIVTPPPGKDIMQTEEVGTETLDAYCTEHNIHPSFLKIDVEGNELRVFRGGSEMLRRDRPKILVEIEARHVGRDKVRETLQYLHSMGYKGHFLHGLDRIPVESFSFEKYQDTGNMADYCNNFIFM